MKQLVVNERCLEYRDIAARVADRPVVLLLHEGLGCVALWRQFPEALAAATGCRLIVWSRAGYGASDPYPEPRTARYLHREALEALPALLAALQIERPLLVGHSDGASIALIFAAEYPQQVSGLVLMAPHEFVEDATLAGILAAKRAWTATSWSQKLARYHRDPARVFSDWSDTWLAPEFRDWTIEDDLPAIRCPVLAIQGEDDEYATMRQMDVIAERVKGAELLKLPDCGHAPQRDQEAAVVAAIARFVGQWHTGDAHAS
jgi:pimeloyl-ACP methyl ester carboxylesterase